MHARPPQPAQRQPAGRGEDAATAPDAGAGRADFLGMLRNASASLLGNLASLPLQLLGFIMVARSLGPAVFGQYSFAQEFSLFAVYAADAGLNVIATREMSARPEKAGAILAEMLRLKLLLSAASYAFFLAVGAPFCGEPGSFAALAGLCLANVLLSSLLLTNGVFRAFGRMGWESVVSLLQAVCFCGFTAFAAYSGAVEPGLSAMVLARLASFLPAVALAYFVACRLAPLRREKGAAGPSPLRQGLPIMLAMLAFDALLRVGFLFLRGWSAPEELAMFSVSTRIVCSLWIIPYIFAGAWLSPLCRCVQAGDMAGFAQSSRELARLLLLLAAPLALGIHMTAEPCVLLLFGAGYGPAAPSLRLLAYSVPVLFLFYWIKTSLEALRRQRSFYLVVGAGLAAGLTANVLLVRAGGAAGASAAYLAGMAVSTGLGLFCVYAACPAQCAGLWATLGRVGCATAAAALAYGLLAPASIPLAGLAACAAYGGALLLLGEPRPGRPAPGKIPPDAV